MKLNWIWSTRWIFLFLVKFVSAIAMECCYDPQFLLHEFLLHVSRLEYRQDTRTLPWIRCRRLGRSGERHRRTVKDPAGGTDNGTMEMGLKSAKSGSDPQIRGRIWELIRGDLTRVIWRNLSFVALLAPEKPFYWWPTFQQQTISSGLSSISHKNWNKVVG